MQNRLFVMLMGVFAMLSPVTGTMTAVMHGEAHLRHGSSARVESWRAASCDSGDAPSHSALHDCSLAQQVLPFEAYPIQSAELQVVQVERRARVPISRTDTGRFLQFVSQTLKPRGPPAA